MSNIDFTARGSGYYRVFVDDVAVSQHTTEREALERATELEQADPSRDVRVEHDYIVDVEETEPNTQPPVVDPPVVDPPVVEDPVLEADLTADNAFDIYGLTEVDVGGETMLRADWEIGAMDVASAKWALTDNPIGETPILNADGKRLFISYIVCSNETSFGEKQSRLTSFAGGNWSQNWVVHFWGAGQEGQYQGKLDPAGVTRNEDGTPQSTGYNTALDWSPPQHEFAAMLPNTWYQVTYGVDLVDDVVYGAIAGEDRELPAELARDVDAYGANAFFLEVYTNEGNPRKGSRVFGRIIVSTDMPEQWDDLDQLPNPFGAVVEPPVVEPPVVDPPIIIDPPSGNILVAQMWDYDNYQDMLADPAMNRWRANEAGKIEIIKGQAPGGHNSMRVTFFGNGSHSDHDLGMNWYIPNASSLRLKEFYMRVPTRWSSNWTVDGPYNPGSVGHKQLFFFDQYETGAARWEHINDLFNANVVSVTIAGDWGPGLNGHGSLPTMKQLYNGQWQDIIYYVKVHPSLGNFKVIINNHEFPWSPVGGDTEYRSDSYINQVAFCRNTNGGVAEDMWIEFGPAVITATDPRG